MGEWKAALYVANPDVALREDDPDGALLFNPDTNQVRVLNATGLFIWRLCDGTRDAPAMVAQLQEAFEGVPEDQVAKHVRAFVEDMLASGFIGTVQDARRDEAV